MDAVDFSLALQGFVVRLGVLHVHVVLDPAFSVLVASDADVGETGRRCDQQGASVLDLQASSKVRIGGEVQDGPAQAPGQYLHGHQLMQRNDGHEVVVNVRPVRGELRRAAFAVQDLDPGRRGSVKHSRFVTRLEANIGGGHLDRRLVGAGVQ